VLPPRHFKRWTEIPVSALATFKPVIVRGTSSSAFAHAVESSPHVRFPVADSNGCILGTVTRRDAALAATTGADPVLDPPSWISAKATVGKARKQMLAGHGDFLCIGDPARGQLEGVLTLHDLLRGESVLEEDG
jgi:CBS domain containing-hemolysin-like protein